MAPRVSVVMNCFNAERFLIEAIESVFAQSFSDWEIVFWDNRSTDASAAVARRYEPKLRYFLGDRFLPLGAARNEALARVRGEYVALLDCDDIWMSDKLERQVSLLDGGGRLGLVYADAFVMDASGAVLTTWFSRVPPHRGEPLLELLTRPNFVPCPCVVMRTDLVRELGAFDSTLRYAEEYELFVRLAGRGDFGYVPRPLAAYRLHAGQAMGMGSAAATREALAVIRGALPGLVGFPAMARLRVRRRLLALAAKLLVQTLAGPRSRVLGRVHVETPSSPTPAPGVLELGHPH